MVLSNGTPNVIRFLCRSARICYAFEQIFDYSRYHAIRFLSSCDVLDIVAGGLDDDSRNLLPDLSWNKSLGMLV